MDFSNYVFGIKPLFKDFTLGFSLAVWSVYLLILLVASFVYFIKRDIKKYHQLGKPARAAGKRNFGYSYGKNGLSQNTYGFSHQHFEQ